MISSVCFVTTVRIVIFAIVWLLTWGKLSFWLLPNLTEDVGFFDSFRPIYECTFAGAAESIDEGTTPGSDGDNKGVEPDDGAGGQEEEKTVDDDVEELEAAGEENENDEDIPAEDGNSSDDDVDDDNDAEKDEDQLSASAADNGYEMISAKDVENGDRDVNAGGEESRPAAVRRRKGKQRVT